jgi:hypothetical protein
MGISQKEAVMSATATIRLPVPFLEMVKAKGAIEHRKIPQQIEYCVEIAQCGIDNPELSFSEIKDMLAGVKEHKAGMVTSFDFDQ